MSPILVFSVIAGYFILLMTIAHFTSKNTDAESFFTANRQSPWYLVAFGMIGASLSGVTFISVPGEVGNSHWAYFQMVLGYLLGYFVIATVLLPLYYKMNLISIYQYLDSRFGKNAYKTGAFFFLISRVIGASFRLFLVATVLQIAFFDAFNIPFSVSVFVTIALIWLYTFKGGIKTIVWTDTLQTLFMLLAVGISISIISSQMNLSFSDLLGVIQSSELSDTFIWDWQAPRNFFKQFFAGAFIAIVMTGLDQDMMQKNLTCKSLGDAQKNVFWFSIVLIFANLLFLALGVLLYHFVDINQIDLTQTTDGLYPYLAMNHFGILGGIVFLLGVTAAAYSSADSALTALTTSFYIDFLSKDPSKSDSKSRMLVHFGFSALIFLVILLFEAINDDSVINAVFKVAGYTYGPLLGLYAFGLFTKRQVNDQWVPIVCIAAPILSYLINEYSVQLLGGYQFGFELLLVNGLFTFIGLSALIKKS
ncbi:sodium:solute symporter [Reichenbachiella carrageenanivorans]|uniref:Sodium:solute symporter n=1 Tax=Reichenbachiella carrageenanivorans TaxID=2979869 RepID=A0ABY6D513_9BACT|nr:sodium:solute symporter [Reichenbachiella carrageenanivorans]UXX81254.1 sodium:solute symporter [Reichenbachiella carrageenanivorans]